MTATPRDGVERVLVVQDVRSSCSGGARGARAVTLACWLGARFDVRVWRHDSSEEGADEAFRAFVRQETVFDAIVVDGIGLAHLADEASSGTLRIVDVPVLAAADDCRALAADGAPDGSMSLADELRLLSRMDAVIALRHDDSIALRSLLRQRIVLHCPHAIWGPFDDFALDARGVSAVGYIASTGPAGCEALRWLVDQVAPILASRDMRIVVYGAADVPTLRTARPAANVMFVGRPNDVELSPRGFTSARLWATDCDVFVNPTTRGDSAAVDCAMALCAGRSLVATPYVADSVQDPDGSGILVAASRGEFVASLLALSADAKLRRRLTADARRSAAERLDAERAWQPLAELIRQFAVV